VLVEELCCERGDARISLGHGCMVPIGFRFVYSREI
jgi:hypothetical protein